MAQHDSALKQMRQGLRHRERNRQQLSKLKTQIKVLRAALSKGDRAAAAAALGKTVSAIDKAAKVGVIHDNAAARYKSRLTRRVNGLAAGA